MRFHSILLILALVPGLYSCAEKEAPEELLPFGVAPFDEPDFNKRTEKGVALGKKLFHDPILSGNNQISCATCHVQELAFSDGVALRKSVFSENQLSRNVPALINAGWIDKGLFWDGGVPNLEFLIQAPIKHPDEMNQNLMVLEKELNASDDYPALFKDAFGLDSVKFPEVSNALSQYVRSLISANSKYDAYKRGGAELTDEEQKGYTLYRQHCAACHTEGLFTDNDFHNNGLDSLFDNDSLLGTFQGRFRITTDSADMGKFRTPTLRNVEVTAPYMHDGRFETLDDVLEHYSHGVKNSASIDEKLIQNNGTLGIPMSEEEKKALRAFLVTLSDLEFMRNNSYKP